MIHIEKTLYPGGTDHVLTMSYDDGTHDDRRLVEIFNKYGIRGSFHLISSRLGTPNCVAREEVATLYKGHEVSSHTLNHLWNTKFASENVIYESIEDRRDLESLCGYVVRGMSYPYGDYDERTVELFRACARILDIHAKGVSKANAARSLQKQLGKKILVCVGDADNDILMLDNADFAFCPADGIVADRYETVCDCAKGAVADVIYKKIPQILHNHP